MVYIKINNGIFFNKVTFFDSKGDNDKVVNAYGKNMARVVKVARALAWFFTGGYLCNTKLVRIPGERINYLYEKTLTEQITAAGETPPATFSKEALGKMIQIVKNKPVAPVQPKPDPSSPVIAPVQPQSGPSAPVIAPVQPKSDPSSPVNAPVQPKSDPSSPVNPNIKKEITEKNENASSAVVTPMRITGMMTEDDSVLKFCPEIAEWRSSKFTKEYNCAAYACIKEPLTFASFFKITPIYLVGYFKSDMAALMGANKVAMKILEKYGYVKYEYSFLNYQTDRLPFPLTVWPSELTSPSPITSPTLKTDKDGISNIKKELQSNSIPSLHTLEKTKQKMSETEKGLDALFNSPPAEILPGLYLGSQRQAGVIPSHEAGQDQTITQMQEQLTQRMGIDTIITCSLEEIPPSNRLDGITYHHFGFGDKPGNEDFAVQLPKIIKTIRQARSENRKIFIHCNAGASRSPSCVLAYLMTLGLNFEEAYRYLKSKRLIVDVTNFEERLKNLNIEAL